MSDLIKETSVIQFIGTWKIAMNAVTDPNEGTAFPVPGFAAAEHQQRAGLVPPRVILMSTDPIPGCTREYEVFDENDVEEIEDPCGGSWVILEEDNLVWARWGSATSGSTIEIDRLSSDNGPEWKITGTFPVVDGVRHEGVYWDALQAAIANLRGELHAAEELARISQYRRKRWEDMLFPLMTAMSAVEGFQDWNISADQEIVDIATETAARLRWTVRTVTVPPSLAYEICAADDALMLELVPPSGWDADFRAEAELLSPGHRFRDSVTVPSLLLPQPEPEDWERGLSV